MLYSKLLERPKYARHRSQISYIQDEFTQPQKNGKHYYSIKKQKKDEGSKLYEITPFHSNNPEKYIRNFKTENSEYPDLQNIEQLKSEIIGIRESLFKKRVDKKQTMNQKIKQIYKKIDDDKLYLKQSTSEYQHSGAIKVQKDYDYSHRQLPRFNHHDNQYQYIYQKNAKEKRRNTEEHGLQLVSKLQKEDAEVLKQNKLYFPTIKGPGYYNSYMFTPQKQYMYYIPKKIKIYQKNNIRIMLNFKKFRKVAHCILFTLYLKRYNKHMQRNRKNGFVKFVRDDMKQNLLDLKLFFVESSKKMFEVFIEKHDIDYILRASDSPSLINEKILNIKKILNLELQSLERSLPTLLQNLRFIETVYFICRHGSYSVQELLHTREELDIICISDKFGYLSSDNFLEQSNIICLLFIKMLLFNILLQPEKINFLTLPAEQDAHLFYNNIKLVGNILYEIFIQIQDNLLHKADKVYKIGNYKDLQYKHQIKAVQSMTIKPNFYKQNQLVSGLFEEKIIKKQYDIANMNEEQAICLRIVNKIQKSISTLHRKYQKKYFEREENKTYRKGY